MRLFSCWFVLASRGPQYFTGMISSTKFMTTNLSIVNNEHRRIRQNFSKQKIHLSLFLNDVFLVRSHLLYLTFSRVSFFIFFQWCFHTLNHKVRIYLMPSSAKESIKGKVHRLEKWHYSRQKVYSLLGTPRVYFIATKEHELRVKLDSCKK